MKNLNLKENQFAVGKAEFATGHVLKNDYSISFSNSDSNQNEIFEIFDDFQIAKDFAKLKVSNNPKIECWIINSKNETIFTWDLNGERIV